MLSSTEDRTFSRICKLRGQVQGLENVSSRTPTTSVNKHIVSDTLNNRLSGMSSYFPALDPQSKSSLGLKKTRYLATLVLSCMNEFVISTEMHLFCMIKLHVSNIYLR